MAVKLKRQQLEVFNLSFLDIISCAFGAIVMLVLLAKNGDEGDFKDLSSLTELLAGVSQAESQLDGLNAQIAQAQSQLAQLSSESEQTQTAKQQLESEVAAAQRQQQQLEDAASGLETVLETQQRAATQAGDSDERVEEVGGIPVDSDYVIFIVDTSGSMQAMWSRVLREMDNILDNHPEVKGFQVMNDMGRYLVSSNRGGWLKDSPRIRGSVLSAMRNWSSVSNSSPVEGLQEALRTYAKRGTSLSIYILGDEYTGGSYDPVIRTLNELNTDKISGERLARVHGIGFIPRTSGSNFETTRRFATLMREVTKQNNGTFLALPIN